MVIEFIVLGTPAPKGSSRAMLRGGAAVNVPSGSDQNRKALASWGAAVRAAASAAVLRILSPGSIPFCAVPVQLQIEWRMRRPGGHFHKTGPMRGQLKAAAPRYPISKPDSSKLLRATEDDMTGIVFDDDSRVAVTQMRKVYAMPGQEGAWIRVSELNHIGVAVP